MEAKMADDNFEDFEKSLGKALQETLILLHVNNFVRSWVKSHEPTLADFKAYIDKQAISPSIAFRAPTAEQMLRGWHQRQIATTPEFIILCYAAGEKYVAFTNASPAPSAVECEEWLLGFQDVLETYAGLPTNKTTVIPLFLIGGTRWVKLDEEWPKILKGLQTITPQSIQRVFLRCQELDFLPPARQTPKP
jgi:hypothetical protein